MTAQRILLVLGAAIGAGALVLTGCSGVQTLDIKPPAAGALVGHNSVAPTTSTTVAEPAVAGATTTTDAVVGPGHASLNGTVFGPQGPVKGATVLAERTVGGASASVTASTGADGSWTIGNILGGRYRVRAWMTPSLAETSPQIVYLSDGQVLSMAIEVSKFQGPAVTTSVSPAVPMVGQATDLAVQVVSPGVGPDGVVRNPPAVGTTVSLVDDPGWTVTGTGSSTTGASGVVVFQISCQFPGDNPLSVAVGTQPPAPVKIPTCVGPPQPPTTPAPSSTTTTTTSTPGPPTS